MSWDAKKCSLPNHDFKGRVALSNSGKLPAVNATARESKDAFKKFPDAAIVMFRENVMR